LGKEGVFPRKRKDSELRLLPSLCGGIYNRKKKIMLRSKESLPFLRGRLSGKDGFKIGGERVMRQQRREGCFAAGENRPDAVKELFHCKTPHQQDTPGLERKMKASDPGKGRVGRENLPMAKGLL